MTTPKWAQDFILNSLIHLDKLGYDVKIPDVKWRKPRSYYGRRKCSSGVCYRDHITICAGSQRNDCKLVILHELAHWVRPWGEHHSDKFWDTAWELFRWAKLPIRYCLQREKTYRKGAEAAYHRSKS